MWLNQNISDCELISQGIGQNKFLIEFFKEFVSLLDKFLFFLFGFMGPSEIFHLKGIDFP